MAITSYLYASYAQKLARGEIDFADDTIKVALCTSLYTPNQDTHDYFDDITNEVSDASYTPGGNVLASKTDNVSGDVCTLDNADTTFTALTATFRYAIVYKDTGTSGTSPLIAYINFGEDIVRAAADLTIVWSASGLINITVPSA